MIRYYKVGGCVRDEILGIRSKDIDYAVEAPSYEAMLNDIEAKGSLVYQRRPEFLAVRANHPTFGPVDFTLCRKDGFYSDSRHPDNVEPGTIYDDLARRDFTVNAIAKREDGTLLDPHGGRIDLQSMTLRCVGNPLERFTEDPLRLLRAVRFHIVREFKLDPSIDSILYDANMIGLLSSIPIERKYEEISKCFAYDTWKTLTFFRRHVKLERFLFNGTGLILQPGVRY